MDDFFNRLPKNTNVTFSKDDYLEAERDNQKMNRDIEKASVKRFENTTELRNSLAIIFTITIFTWLFSVIIILMNNHFLFKLSDSVLIVLLTTTTIQVLGMMVIILRDLFPGRKNDSS